MRWSCPWSWTSSLALVLVLAVVPAHARAEAQAGTIEEQCRQVADTSLRWLSQRNYDEYLKCFDPESAGFDAVQGNIVRRRELDPTLSRNDTHLDEFGITGADTFYIYANAVQSTTLVIVEKGAIKTVDMQQYVLIIFNKQSKLISFMFPLRLLKRDVKPSP